MFYKNDKPVFMDRLQNAFNKINALDDLDATTKQKLFQDYQDNVVQSEVKDMFQAKIERDISLEKSAKVKVR